MNAEQWARRVMETGLSDLPKLYEEMGPKMAQQVALQLENLAKFRVREATYLKARSRGLSHDAADDQQIKRTRKVHRAMGYPGDDDLHIQADE